MAEFDITDIFNIPETATNVTVSIRLTKPGEDPIESFINASVVPPTEVFTYSGTFGLVGGSNGIAYRSTGDIISEGFEETQDEPIGQITVDGRLSDAGNYESNTGIRWRISNDPPITLPNGETIPYWKFYMDYLYGTQSWTLIVNSTEDGVFNDDPDNPAGNLGTTTWKYVWPGDKMRKQSGNDVGANLQLNADAISTLDSDEWPTDPDDGGNAWDLWGENPTFEFSVGGVGGSLPDAGEDSTTALESYFNVTEDDGVADLGGNVYCISTAEELETYSDVNKIIKLNGKKITVENGAITGALHPKLLNWSTVDDSVGVFKATLDSEIVNSSAWNGRFTKWQLVDTDQTSNPRLQIRVPSDMAQDVVTSAGPSDDFEPYRFTWTSDWMSMDRDWSTIPSNLDSGYYSDATTPTDVDAYPVEVGNEGSYFRTIQFKDNFGGNKLYNHFNSVTNGAFENGTWQDLTLLIHHYPNVISVTHIADFDLGTRTITVDPARNMQHDDYFKFALSGVGNESDFDVANNLNEGEYFFKPSTNTLYYRPDDPSVIRNHITNGNSEETLPKVYIPAISQLIKLGAGSELTLNNVNVIAQNSRGRNPYFITGPNNPDPANCATLRLLGCKTNATIEVCKDVIIDAKNCVFEETINRFLTVLYGEVKDCYFGNSYNKSCLNVTGKQLQQTKVTGNFVALEASAHGQFYATYHNTWQNSICENNIFYNCKAILSFQPAAGGYFEYDNQVENDDGALVCKPTFVDGEEVTQSVVDEYGTFAGGPDVDDIDEKCWRPWSDGPANYGNIDNMEEYRFANNLVYTDRLLIVPVMQGQTGLAFNGSYAYHLDTRQKVNFLSNTMWTDTEYEAREHAANNINNKFQLTITKLVSQDVICANNIIRSIRMPGVPEQEREREHGYPDFLFNQEPEFLDVDGTTRLLPRPLTQPASLFNAIYGRNIYNARDDAERALGDRDFGNDLPFRDDNIDSDGNPVDQGAINPAGAFDENNLIPIGQWENKASDGGNIGVRWTQIPTVNDIKSINDNRGKDPVTGEWWNTTYQPADYPLPNTEVDNKYTKLGSRDITDDDRVLS